MCFYASMPGLPSLLRMISAPYTNRQNLWLQNAIEIVGPNAFRESIRGYEEYDPDYLLLNYETFAPAYYKFGYDYWFSRCLVKDDSIE